MRLPRVVARAALIAALALVVVPRVAGSRIPSTPGTIDPQEFSAVDIASVGTTATTLEPDLAGRSGGHLDPDEAFGEPAGTAASASGPARPTGSALPASNPITQVWHLDSNISWYGPGFYGHNGACGLVPGGIQPDTVGVAHRTLPCGTKVTFRYNGRTVTTRVIDRGPYVSGRTWDMTRGLCALLGHCFTGGGVYWRIG